MISIRKKIVLAALLCLFSLGTQAGNSAADNPGVDAIAADEGIRFSCAPDRIADVEAGTEDYLASMGITPDQFVKRSDFEQGVAVYTLNTPKDDFNTLKLKDRPEYAIKDQVILLPVGRGQTRKIKTVSQKEIVLALLQHGRVTSFDGGNCSVDALKEHVGIRQNIVAWAENLNWRWPNGGDAKWNAKYWRKGTPLPGVRLTKAIGDAFKHQRDYAIGCYTATKMVMVQGVLDYYRRVNKEPGRQRLIEARLEHDRDPLVDIEPGRMWSFETDFDPGELKRPGKLLQIQYGVAPRNFVPGDWIYILNTDPVSSDKTGYEGSNAIYLGRNRFDDYYDDNDHSYTYRQKLDEVYQWRNGVFSRSRDAAKIKPLTDKDYKRLSATPANGGLTIDVRVFPYIFAGGELPSL